MQRASVLVSLTGLFIFTPAVVPGQTLPKVGFEVASVRALSPEAASANGGSSALPAGRERKTRSTFALRRRLSSKF